ncbi:MAG: hypothetical protein AB8E15_11040 [Bdellovibrionales bacterium]
MIINCPKCGFEQPQDEYCANCGVHIPSFKPPEIGIQQRALKSAGFYTFLLFALGIGSGYFFVKTWKSFDTKIDQLNVGDLKDLVKSDDEFVRPNNARKDIVIDVKKQVELAPLLEITSKNKEDKTLTNLDWSTYKLSFAFMELTPAQASQYWENEDDLQEQGDYLIYKATPKVDFVNTSSLSRFESGVINEELPIVFTESFSQDQTNLELEVNWTSTESIVNSEFSLSYQFDSNSGPIQKALAYSAIIEPGSMIIIRGFLPQTSIVIPEDSLSTDVLNIYKSPAFLENQTDFYFVIYLGKN